LKNFAFTYPIIGDSQQGRRAALASENAGPGALDCRGTNLLWRPAEAQL